MGSGKTTVGQLLAQQLQWHFIDTDTEIEKQQHLSCQKIIELYGIDFFRQLENQILRQLTQTDLSNTIIATGGGMPCNSDNLELMLLNGHVVYIKWSAENLATRLLLTDLTTRPLLKDSDPIQLTQQIRQDLNQREKYYSQANQIITAPVNNNYCSAEDDFEIAKQIYSLI